MGLTNGRKDVTIHPPAAAAILHPNPPGETIEDVRRELQAMKVTADTVANVALALVKMIQEGLVVGVNAEGVKIPAAVSERMAGGSIHVAQAPDGDVVVKVVERKGPFPPILSG